MDRDRLLRGKGYLTSGLFGGLPGTMDEGFALSIPEDDYVRIESSGSLVSSIYLTG